MGTPAELPAEIHGYKSQQYRWNKGGAETARKIIPSLLRSQSAKSQKLHGIVHLLNSSVYLFILTAAILSVPMLWVAESLFDRSFYLYLSVFLAATIATSIVFFIALYATIDKKKRALPYYLSLFPLFLSVNLGLSWHNARAVINGLRGKRTPFIRTPKFNITSKKDDWKKKKYRVGKLDFNTIMEGLFTLYFLAGIALGIHYGDYGMMVIHIMAAFGFATIFYHSVFQKWLVRS